MGVRLYNPSTGRFLSTDPVPGGNANAYEYCTADPITCYDLDGKFSWRKAWHSVKKRNWARSAGMWATSPSVWQPAH